MITPKSKKKLFYMLIVTLNIIVLIFIFRIFSSQVKNAKSRVQFKWGENAPKMLDADISGKPIEVIPGTKSLILLVFFNNKVINEISQINEMWKSWENNDDLILIGIFNGDKKTGEQIIQSSNLRFSVIIDNRSIIHKRYHFFPPPSRGAILVLDKSMKVLMSINFILKPDLLNDFIRRNTSNKISLDK